MTQQNHNQKVDWKTVLTLCRRVLGRGAWEPELSESWCAYTTFSSLEHGVVYWNCGFPDECEILESQTLDGGLWRQAIHFDDLAHLIVPARFYWEKFVDSKFKSGYKTQDTEALSQLLTKNNTPHTKSDRLLEIKLY